MHTIFARTSLFVFFIALLFIGFAGFAQAPNLLNYQGVARNAVGNPLPNQTINLRLSVRNLSATGAVVYSETRPITTSLGGLFSVQIGSAGASSTTGTIGGAGWFSGDKYLQVEIDPASNNNFLHMGTVQLVSVPYAFSAGTSGNAATVTTNANLTGAVTSIGNLTSLAVSPALTGVPTAPTAALGNNTTQIATTAFVQAAALTGPTGAKGVQGIQGLAGADGAAGPQGIPGVAGPIGPEGPQGIPGTPGAAGTAGQQGIQGVAGPVGPAGAQGIQGLPGADGAAGLQGTPGAAGAVGPQGIPGATGSVANVGTISNSSTTNGASITSGVLSLAPADAVNGGIITTGVQTFAGAKTFSSTLAANGTITAGEVTYPNTKGTLGQVLISTASGILTWAPNSVVTVTTVGTISNTSTPEGGYFGGNQLILTPADEINGGVISSIEQSISGRKIFSSTDGLIATGKIGEGNPSTLGAGPRMMWMPRKAGFRAGGMSDAQWDDSTKIGRYSSAFGENTLASGDYSFVGGHADTASAFGAVAFGQYATASQSHAFAMGYGAKANGYASIALGHQTKTSSAAAIAMGYQTTASNFATVALGQGTTASGSQSTAFGLTTIASGASSTSMGQSTTASGTQSTAFGLTTTASGSQSTALGQGTIASGNHSIAMGLNTTASQDQAIAMGQGTIASNYNSTVMGLNTTASGYQSTAMGQGTLASNSTTTAMGLNSTASGVQSTAFGQETLASGSTSTSIGLRTTASGDQSTAMGQGTIASGYASTAMGNTTKASGGHSTAMGYQTLASGDQSLAAGLIDSATSSQSVALGNKTKASGQQSLAAGYNSKASGNHSFAMGFQNIASADQSFATGNKDTASGSQSIAMGLDSKASSNSSVAIGNNVKAVSYGETALGIFNTNYTPTAPSAFDSTDRLFVIGNGLDDTHRSNAITILKNGNTTIAGTITAGAMTYPNRDSTVGLFLATNANGIAEWTSIPNTVPSDIRLKKEIKPIETSLSQLLKLSPVSYVKKSSLASTNYNIKENGFIAQELQKLFPELVVEGNDKDKLLSVNYISLIPILTKSIQEQQQQIADQDKVNEALKKQMDLQQNEIDQLKKLVEELIKKK
jgi:hypothetical protein